MKYDPLSAGPAAVKYGLDVRVCARMRVCVKEREREREREREVIEPAARCMLYRYV